jgi:TP901 family phage tail tape measure protein
MADTDLTITISGKDAGISTMLEKLTRALDKLEKDAKDTSQKMATTTKSVESGFTRMASTIQQSSQKISSQLSRLSSISGRVLGVLGIGGLTGTIYKSIGAFSAFEDSMKEISTLISGDATKAVAGYAASIKKLSAESGKSTGELSKGLYQIISAGTKGTEDAAGAMNLLNIAQKAATAGVSNTFAAVDALTTTLNSYNRTTEDAAKFSDIMFTTVKLGKTTFNELAAKIGMVAATAANANVDFGELNAGIAQLTKGGLNTATAITSLNALIVAMLKPSKELDAAVMKLGKGYSSVGDMLGKEGLGGVMKFLNEQTGGNAEAMGKLIPSVEGARAAAILAGGGFSEFEKTLASFKNTTGATEEAYGKMTETFTFKLQQFRAKMELMFLEIGEKLMPIVMGMLDDISKWFEANSGKIVAYVQEFATAALEMLRFLVNHADTIIKVMAAIWVTEKVASFTASILDLTRAFGGLKQVMATLGAGNIGKLLVALGGGSAVLGAAGAAAAIGGTIYAAKNLVDPELLKKEGGASEGPGIPGLAGYTPGAGAPEWAKALSGGDIAQLIAENAKEAAKETSEAIKEETKKNSDTRRKLTEKEIEEARKKREEALKYLDGLEVASMTEREKLQDKHEKEIANIRKLGGISEFAKEAEIAALRERQAEELAEYEYKQMSDRIELEMGAAENLAKEKEETAKRDREFQEKSLALLLEHEQEKKKKLSAFWGDVAVGFARRVGEKLYDWALEIGSAIVSPITNLMGGFTQMAGKPFGFISDIFNSILGGAGFGEVKDAAMQAAQFFTNLAEKMPSAISWFANEGVMMIINSFADNIGTVIQALVDGVPKIIDHMIENLDRVVLPFVDGMLQLIPALIERIPELVGKVAELLGPAIAKIFDNLPNILSAALQSGLMFLPKLMGGILNGIRDIFTSKSKAERATKMSTGWEQAALKMGYTAEMAAAVREAGYEREMGRLIDPEQIETWARYVYNYTYKQAIKDGKNEDEAKAIAFQAYEAEKKKAEGDRAGYSGLSTHEFENLGSEGTFLPSDALDKMHSGGYVEAAGNLARAIRAHSGYAVPSGLAPDEVPIIAQAGEAIMNRKWVQNAGGKQAVDDMNRTGGGGGKVVNNVYVEHMMSGDTAQVIDKLITGNLRAGAGKLYEKFNTGRAVGYKTRRA